VLNKSTLIYNYNKEHLCFSENNITSSATVQFLKDKMYTSTVHVE